MRKSLLLQLATVVALVWAGQAYAKPDSLLQPGKGDGKTFTIYHLYSKPDGTTVVEDAPVTLTDKPSDAVGDQKILFTGPLNNFTIRWSPNGMTFPKDVKTNHEQVAHMQLVLQGTFVFWVSNGKKVRVGPGNLTLQTDSDGYGHHLSCEEPKKGLGCLQINMDPKDATEFFKNMKQPAN